MAIYKKHGSWYIDYYVKGVRKRKKIGTSKHVADLALAQVKVKIPRGKYLGIYDDKKITLAQFAEEYLACATANKAPISVRRVLISLVPLTAAFPGYLSEVRQGGQVRRHHGSCVLTSDRHNLQGQKAPEEAC